MNSVKINGPQRTIAYVEHKWWDMKSAAKQSVAKYRKEFHKTGGGNNNAATPSNTHNRIIEIIDEQSVSGIGGASHFEAAIS